MSGEVLWGAGSALILSALWRQWRGRADRNTSLTSKASILRQLNEPRPLPMGAKEFEEWADRIISGAMVPTTKPESLKPVLACMIQALGPQESHKPDAYFIHSLRKAAANEVARAKFTEEKLKREADSKAQEALTTHT